MAAGAFLLILIGTAWAGTFDFNTGQQGVLYKGDMQGDVTGTGYVWDYQKINTNNLSMMEYSHGSGAMDFADVLSSAQTTTTSSSSYSYYYLNDKGWLVKAAKGGNSVISYTKQYDNVQSPTAFAYGTGWYATHPVIFNSFIKDKNVAKSYQEGVSMQRQVEYARGLKGDIAIDLNCTGPSTAGVSGKGTASMKINDKVIQGTMHVGVLFTNTLLDSSGKNRNFKIQGIKEPIIQTDQDYIGDFEVQKTIKFEISKSPQYDSVDWLPCCMGGFFDVPSYNIKQERPGQVGIFDCTCRGTSISTMQPKWNTSQAQFPESDYKYKA
ncbi:MAG: hypothetical protein ACE14P_04460 [Methanotrichaceae archaeon]